MTSIPQLLFNRIYPFCVVCNFHGERAKKSRAMLIMASREKVCDSSYYNNNQYCQLLGSTKTTGKSSKETQLTNLPSCLLLSWIYNKLLPFIK